MKIRHLAAVAALILVAPALAQPQPGSGGRWPADHWIGTWGFVPTPMPPGAAPPLLPPSPVAPLAADAGSAMPGIPPGPVLLDNPGNVPLVTPQADPANVTLRQIVRVSAGGGRIRLRLCNEGGNDVLVLGAVHVGVAGPDGRIVPGTDKTVTFDGHGGVSVPASAPLLSDPVAMPVTALQKLAITFYVPGTLTRGGHALYQYVSGQPGDQSAAPTLPDQSLMRITALVSEVEVQNSQADSVVVTFGDSITEGATSTNNAFRGWPDRLAERLNADPAGRRWAVVNAGIGGNRLLRYGSGPNALARLDRDVLSVPGVKAVILLEGINDIGRGFQTTGTQEPVTAASLIAADKQIIARCHEQGIRVIGATLTPYGGAFYGAPAGEQARQALNHWILTSGAFDGVVDFAKATADPADPLTFRAGFNIRDHLHPNDAGYRAMGDAIDLGTITGK